MALSGEKRNKSRREKGMDKKLYEQPDMYIHSVNNCNIIVMSGTGWDDDFDNPTEGGIIL